MSPEVPVLIIIGFFVQWHQTTFISLAQPRSCCLDPVVTRHLCGLFWLSMMQSPFEFVIFTFIICSSLFGLLPTFTACYFLSRNVYIKFLPALLPQNQLQSHKAVCLAIFAAFTDSYLVCFHPLLLGQNLIQFSFTFLLFLSIDSCSLSLSRSSIHDDCWQNNNCVSFWFRYSLSSCTIPLSDHKQPWHFIANF